MNIEIVKTVGAFEVVRVTNRGMARSRLLDPSSATALPDYLGVRRRYAPDREDHIQGPFSTLQQAMDHARGEDHHWKSYEE